MRIGEVAGSNFAVKLTKSSDALFVDLFVQTSYIAKRMGMFWRPLLLTRLTTNIRNE